MAYVPIFVNINSDDRIVIIGGGKVALAKAEALATSNARVEVVAEQIIPALQTLLQQTGGRAIVSPYHGQAIAGAKLVIAATNDGALNQRIYDDAKALHIPVNVVDNPDLCDFIFPAIVNRGNVQIAISSSGINPTLARLIKRRIEHILPWNLAELANWLKSKREIARSRIKSLQARRLFWEEVLEGATVQEVLEGNHARADWLFQKALNASPADARAALYLVGAGPGHPDFITLRGAQILGQADVILYDRLIPTELLSRYARKDALKIYVGKQRATHTKTQEEIDALLQEHLLAKRIVVRLKGGDPSVYAHSAEELAIAVRLGVPYQIVPGITAALGCAAYCGIPLTERGGANGIRFLTLYDEQVHDDAFWQSLALSRHETLVFYMSTGKRSLLCEKLLETGFDAATPMLAIEQGTTPQHREYEATIGSFDKYAEHRFLTPVTIIVGDVVRWRSEYRWKEEVDQRHSYFDRKGVAHVG